MYRILSLIVVTFICIKHSLAVQCNTNPCELAGDFLPPNYQCLPALDNPNNVICTCPDGHVETNRRCRVCESINCGLNAVCIERSFFEGLYYACGCTNGTDNYLNPGPCPVINPITTTTTTTITPPVGICLNGGVYNSVTGICTCINGYTGRYCEIPNAQTGCQNIVCANGGVCNPNPPTENGIIMHCSCPNGFTGPNCELVGTLGRCTLGLCQNGGVCEERLSGSTTYAFCRCPPGITGQCCQTSYFSCPMAGVFADPINCKFGKYFQCNGYTLSSLSCPRGLRYNFMKMRCDTDVSCPP
ncbi:hypothetical protein I4U23_008804 [Adineta vaga]|nr:hypothetical protein I4U23_008804 [Adineta vaga]